MRRTLTFSAILLAALWSGTAAAQLVATPTYDNVTAGRTNAQGGPSANQVTMSGANSGSPATITAHGSDANVGLNLVTQGTGAVLVNGVPVPTLPAVVTAGHMLIAGGTPGQIGDGGALPASGLVGLTDTQTLTNKTLTAPVISGGGTFNNTPITASVPFQQNSQNLQSIFMGTNAGAAYPIGSDAGYTSVGIGAGSLQSYTATNGETTCLGTWSCQYLTTGLNDTGIGMHALGAELTQNGDTAVGNDAMRNAISTGGYVTAIGQAALHNGVPGNHVVAIGTQAVYGNSEAITIGGTPTTGDVIQLVLSSSASGLTGLPLTVSHTVVGGDTISSIASALAAAINNNISGPSYSIQAAAAQIGGSSSYAVYLGFPGNNTLGWAITITPTVTGAATETASVSTGAAPSDSVIIGFQAAVGHQMGATVGNNIIGFGAAGSITTASYNDIMGDQAAGSITTGTHDEFMGFQAGYNCTTCAFDIGIGYQTLSQITTSGANTVVGYQAGASVSSGQNETLLGMWAGNAITTGSNNSMVGRQAGYALTTGSNNLELGYAVGSGTLATGSNNILIGTASNCDTPSSSTSNYFAVCAATGSTPLISGTLVATGATLSLNPSGGDTTVGAGSALATAFTTGALHLPFTAGSPTGTPSNTTPGCEWNTSSHTMNCYDGASWYHATWSSGAG